MDAPRRHRQVGALERAHPAVALGDAFHAEERGRAAVHRSLPEGSGGRRLAPAALARYWFASVCPMISWAVKLMPQVGKELPTKKLSDWSG